MGGTSALGLLDAVPTALENYYDGNLSGTDIFYVVGNAIGLGYSLKPTPNTNVPRSHVASDDGVTNASVRNLGPVLLDDVVSGSRTTGAWASRPPGVQVRKIGNYWVKRVDPNASSIMRRWGEATIRAQEKALAKLHAAESPAARFSRLRNGALAIEDVGPTMGGRSLFSREYWAAWWRDTRAIGFPNDLKPGNYGAGFRAFDPAIDSITLSIAGAGGVGVAGGVVYILHNTGVFDFTPWDNQ